MHTVYAANVMKCIIAQAQNAKKYVHKEVNQYYTSFPLFAETNVATYVLESLIANKSG